MAHNTREEIMSSSEVVRNFGAVLSSVVQHQREKVAIIRNNRMEAVLVAVDVYEQMEKMCETSTAVTGAAITDVKPGNSAALLDFLKNNRIAEASRLSPDEIDRQILEERQAWE
jgi:PHD/YefM family antitoxin component YafN of YafNO toxin-antitoxin module